MSNDIEEQPATHYLTRDKDGFPQIIQKSPVDDMIEAHLPENVRKQRKAISLVRDALDLLGMECDRAHPSILRTPERWISYLQEFMQPINLEEVLGPEFPASVEESSIHSMIVQSRIPYAAMCEHHLLPFWGEAFIGYVPNERIVGLSKMARLVDAVSHEKPGLQEAQCEKIADAMFDILKSKGSMVILRATHTCMSCRGVRAEGALTITSCIRGIFRDVPGAREEFLFLAGLR